MPKSKRSAKRRAKLKKRGNKTYGWAARKVETMDPETLQRYLNAQAAIAEMQEKIENIEEENEDQMLQERIERRIDERFEEEDGLQG